MRWIKREAATAGHDAGEVVIGVEVAGDMRAVAEPDARLDFAGHGGKRVVALEPGKVVAHGYRAEIDRVQRGILGRLLDPFEAGRDRHAFPLEIEASHPVGVEVAALDLRPPHESLHLVARVEARQILGERVERPMPHLHGRPVLA